MIVSKYRCIDDLESTLDPDGTTSRRVVVLFLLSPRVVKTAIPPTDPLPEFWGVMEKEAGATQLSGGGQQARVLQTRMVRALKSYRMARITWGHLVVPALFGVPR